MIKNLQKLTFAIEHDLDSDDDSEYADIDDAFDDFKNAITEITDYFEKTYKGTQFLV